MRNVIATAIVLLPIAVHADQGLTGYMENPGVKPFTEQKCGEVIHAVDSDGPGPLTDGVSLDMYARDLGRFFAKQGVTWGFILGYDIASGGLHADGETTLQRLRQACAKDPERTALSILEEFAAQ